MEMKARTRQREAFWSCLSATIRSTPRWSCPSSQSVDSTPSSTAETTGRGSVRPRAGVGKTTGRGRSPVRMFVSSSSFETAAGSRPRRAWYALWRETNGLSSARRLRSVTSRPDCPRCGYGLPGTRPDCPGRGCTPPYSVSIGSRGTRCSERWPCRWTTITCCQPSLTAVESSRQWSSTSNRLRKHSRR